MGKKRSSWSLDVKIGQEKNQITMMPCRKKSGSRQLVPRMKTLKMMMMFRMKELRKSLAKSKNVKRRVKMTNRKRKRKKEPSKKLQKQMRKLLEIVIQYEDQDGRVLS